MGAVGDHLAYMSYNPGGVWSGGGVEGAATFKKKKSASEESTAQQLAPQAPAIPMTSTEKRRELNAERAAEKMLFSRNPLEGKSSSNKTVLGG